jgi:hypothetical protein
MDIVQKYFVCDDVFIVVIGDMVMSLTLSSQ